MPAAITPQEAVAIATGVVCCVVCAALGATAPLYAHAGVVGDAKLMDVANVPLLLPSSFRVEVTVKKTGLTMLQSEDIFLIGGTATDTSCSGGALFVFWNDGAIGFGTQCNGPAPCPSGNTCNDPAIQGKEGDFKLDAWHKVVAEYSRTTMLATVSVDGKPYLSQKVKWNPPKGGPVTLLAGSHSDKDKEPFFGEAKEFAVYALPAGSWGLDVLGALALLAGLYVGLGALYGRRSLGLPGGEGWLCSASTVWYITHPHATKWKELRGLANDGVKWSQRRVGLLPPAAKITAGMGDYSALGDAESRRRNSDAGGSDRGGCSGGGGSDDRGSSFKKKSRNSSSSSSLKKKKSSGKGDEVSAGGGDRASPGSTARAGTTAGGTGTTAGDGGRWVHILA